MRNQRGSTLIAAGATLAFVSLMGLAVVQASASDSENTSNHMSSAKAFYAATAGLEWAKFKIKKGEDPNVSEVALHTAKPDDGRFTVNYDTTTGIVTSTGEADRAKSTLTTAMTTAADCVESPSTPDVNFGYAYGAIYALQVQRKDASLFPECASVPVVLSALNIDNLKNSQKIVQLLYDENTIDPASPDTDGQIYNRDGYNYFDQYAPIDPAYVEGQNIDAVPSDYLTAHFTDFTMVDLDPHMLREIYIDYDDTTLYNDPSDDAPDRGDRFSVNFIFADGSSFNRVVTY